MESGYSGYSGNGFSGFSGPGICFDITYNSVEEANANIHSNYRNESRRVAIRNEKSVIEIYTWLDGWRDNNLVKVDFEIEFTELRELMDRFIKEKENTSHLLIVAKWVALLIYEINFFYKYPKHMKY